MMRYFAWLFRALLFILLLAFAIRNDGLVTVRLFLGDSLQLPLVIVMLVMFVAGVALGATVALATVFAQKREIRRLNKASERRILPRSSGSSELPGF